MFRFLGILGDLNVVESYLVLLDFFTYNDFMPEREKVTVDLFVTVRCSVSLCVDTPLKIKTKFCSGQNIPLLEIKKPAGFADIWETFWDFLSDSD